MRGRGTEGNTMTVLTGADGRVYEMPGEIIEKYRIAPEDLEEKIKKSGLKEPPGTHPQQTRPQPQRMRLCLKR